MPNLDQCIIDQCKASWEEAFLKGTLNKNNCSGFLKSVAGKLGVPLPATANADGLVDAISGSWKKLADGATAAREAAAGNFVVVGLKGPDHTPARNNGHVGIVVAGPLYRGTYPMMWCGSIAQAQSQGTKSVGEVWSRADRDNVGYYEYAVAVCKA